MDFPLFTVGDSGPEVENIQRRLLCPDIDGIYTEELAVRVRGFQLVHHLPLTGEVDEVDVRVAAGGRTVTFDILRVLEFIAVLGTAVATTNRFLVRPIVDAVHRQAEESRALRGVMADVSDIRMELRRNGGTSLKE